MSENHGAQIICIQTPPDIENAEICMLTCISLAINKITSLLKSKVILLAEMQVKKIPQT